MSSESKSNLKTQLYWSPKAGEGPVPVSPKVQFASLDHEVLKLWEEKRIFLRTIEERQGCPDFVAYDGPPGTNGAPHIGHMMQSALKDLWPRYYTMKGFRVLRKAGWDTHGLPIEMTAEKELGLKTKRDILDYGVEKYIDYCRGTVYRYKDAWIQAIKRIGRFLDTENDYATLQREYVETGWWVLKQAWDKGLLYQGRKVMPYSPLSGTTLSAHEVAQGYKEITDLSLYVKFPVVGRENTFLIAWTTTAWTLLSNVALAVNPTLRYVTIETSSLKLIVAEERLEALKGMLGDYKVLEGSYGKDLEVIRYRPLFSFLEGAGDNAFRVIADDYVTAADGAGIVHLAMYGEDDFRIIEKNNLPAIQNVNLDGRCVENTGGFAGRYFREEGLDVDILKDLASRGLLLGKEKIVHSYPHNYKSGEPLMFFAKSAWFLRTSAFKERMLAANEDINWYPDHIKYGRFGNWLENNVDWAISRERFWGTPLPIWTCGTCGERVCVGSLKELETLLGKPLPPNFDPHKPHIDRIEFACGKCGEVMKREPEVLDCWFDAGIMPWGQWGYPGKAGSEAVFREQYPADFICEAIDQTRGWFYTMLAASTLLSNRSSFKNVICTELITDVSGLKMSKSRGNVVDPVEVCETYGADAVRWNFFDINPWTARRFDENDIVECLKQFLIPYWNAYSFFVTYARVDHWKLEHGRAESKHRLDRWITSRLKWLSVEVESALNRYDVAVAAKSVHGFIDDLTNWYIRRSRRRFWKSEDDQDKRAAYGTLYQVLTTLNRMLAPFVPFVSEVVYQNLERGYDASLPDSVHLARWPSIDEFTRDLELEGVMARARAIVSMTLALRNEGAIRVRQPLRELIVAGGEKLPPDVEELILDEVNVKSLRYISNLGELLTHRAKVNLKSLGPKIGGRVQLIAAAVAQWDDAAVCAALDGKAPEVEGVRLTPDDLIVEQTPVEGYWIREESGVGVAVDRRLDDDLRKEWLAREFVHHVQNQRREADLEISQRIIVRWSGSDALAGAVEQHREYIMNETLALELKCDAAIKGEELKAGDQKVRIAINLA